MKFNLKSLAGLGFLTLLFTAIPVLAQRQMEPLGRGVVALHSATSQAYIGWRLLVTDPTDIGFNIYRSANGAAGVKINLAGVLTNTTDFLDTTANFTISNAWYVRPVISGVEQAPSGPSGLAANSPVRQYLSIPLQAVIGGANPPYDVKFAWFGDFDGDGEYDYLVDRLSTTANVKQYLQAYRRDGTFLWQIDMGPNSMNTSGGSTTVYEPSSSAISIGDKDNVTVYDLDGDGKAEVIVRTANGTVFANGAVQSGGASDNVQFLSIVDGLTGVQKARATIPNPYLADGPLNMHAGIAYLDGIRPSVIFSGENRIGDGDFQRITVAWDYRNSVLTQRWTYQTPANHNDSEGHQLRVADVNNDGKDDIIRIASVISDSNGVPVTLYSTELAHGDRYHVTDIDPERPGLEMFAIQQNNSTLLATSLQDLGSGVLYKKWYSGGVVDVGRGITLDLTPSHRGCEMYSTQPGIFNAKGTQIYVNNLWAPEAIWWDADVLREFEDGAGSGAYSPVINKFNPATGNADRIYTLYNEDGGVHQAYGGRAALWGDLFGDWREEFMVVANDYNSVRIYTTKIQATNRIYCLMQNPQYRVQNTFKGYYQASYVDYYLGNDMPAVPVPPVSDAAFVWRGGASSTWDNATANWFTNNLWISNTTAVTIPPATSVLFDASGSNTAPITISGALTPSDVRIHAPKDYTFNSTAGDLTGPMKLTKAGAGKLTLLGTNTYTGATLIGESLFLVNGALPNSPVTVRGGVWRNGRLGGTGVIGGVVRVEEGAGFSPGAGANSPGTLTIANNVTLTGRTLNDFDLSDDATGTLKTNDLVVITGNLTLQGTNTLVIRKLNTTLPPGVYPLITYSGTFSGNLNNLAVSGLPGVPLTLTNPPGQIALVVKSYRAPATINWTGGSGGNVWDLLSTTNFLNGAAKDQFAPGDTVRFDSIGTSNLTANLVGDLNAAAVIVDSTANYTLAGSGSIFGGASLTKSNTGTLTISALNNSYTGKTTIAGGTVVVSELDAVGYPSPLGNPPKGSTNLILSGSSTLRVTGESYTDRGLTLIAGQNTLEVFNAADQVTIAGQIVGSGALVKSGAGTLALTVANTFSGGVIISNGAISLGSVAGNQTGVGTGAVTFYGGTLSMINIQASETAAWPLVVPVGATGRLNVDGRCTLTGSLTGGGTFTIWTPYVRTDFNGNWSVFTGQINVITDDGGDFRCNNSSGYPNARMNLAAATSLQNRVGGTPTISIGELTGAPGAAISAPGGNSGIGVTWSVGGLNTTATYSGNTYNNVNFIKVGTGTWIWNGTNLTHTGPTTVNGGTLLINGNAAAAAGNVTVSASGTLGGSGTVGGATTMNGKLAPGNNAIGTFTCNGNVTFSASGTAGIEINKTAGTRDLLDVGGMLTYNGTLHVTNLAGTLASGDSFKIFDATTYTGSFATFNLPPLSAGLIWNTAALTTSGTISVVISNAGPKAIVWKGDGALNAWDTTTANWLDTNSVAAFFNNFDRVTLNDAGSNNAPIFLSGSLQPAALVVNATKDYTLAGTGSIAGTNSLVKAGSGMLSLATGHSYSGATVVSNGTLRLTTVGLGLAHRWSFNGNLTDSVGGQNATVVDVGANNTTLSASEITLAGGAKDSSDYVDLGDQVLPNGTTPVTIELWAKQISVQNWSRIFDFGAGTTENVFMSWTRGTTLAQDRVEWVDTAGTTTTNDTCQPYTLGVEFHIALVIEPGAGAGGTTRVTWYRAASTDSTIGAARGTFNTTNSLAIMNDTNCWLGRSQWPDNTANASYNEVRTWNRALSATELQTLHSAGADAILSSVGISGTGSLPSSTAVNLAGASAKLENLSGQTQTIASLTGVAGSEIKLITGALVLGGDNTSTTFAGFFSGTNGLTKTGAGTLALTGNSMHTGATTVSAGTLHIHGNNSAANGAVNVASGATLGGNGTLGGTTTIASGATLAPGASIGAITFTNALNLSGTTVMEISHMPLTNDVVNKTDTFTYGGALVVTNISGPLVAGDSFILFNASAYTGSFSSVTLPALNNGLVWTTNTLSTTGAISVSSAVSTTPTNLTYSSTGNSLTLSWPASHIGWTLQAQTNALNTGLGATWYPIPGSTTTNAMTFPVNPANPTVFYRLTYP
jgi:fibronectin-binding autotransporter adhesin